MALCAGAFALTGCNDLDQLPGDQYTEENFWRDHAEYMVMTAYSQMYNDGWIWDWEKLCDNMWNGYRSGDEHVVRRGLGRPTTGKFGWNGYYQGIKSCHVFLANADKIPSNDADYANRLKAEASYIRDWIYFRLTSLYGDIPFFMSDPTLDETKVIKRTPSKEVLSTIKADLEDLIQYLPKKDQLPESERGRLTQAAAATLLARIALWENDYQEAVKWTQNIMNGEYGRYTLFPDYAGLFKAENEYNDEVILDRGYIEKLYTWGAYKNMHPRACMDGADFVSWTPTQSLVDTYLTLGGYRWDEAGTDFDPENPYENRDPRLHASIICDGDVVTDWCTGEDHTIYINRNKWEGQDVYQKDLVANDGNANEATYTGYYARKYFETSLDDTWYTSGTNLIIMRYADVLLMNAEAKEALGQMNAAVWNETIRPIRERAGFTAAKALDFPGGDVKHVIRNERRVELAFEGLRYFDIMRWKAGMEYLNGPVKGCEFVGGNAVLDNYKFDENRDYLWPIPQGERDINPNLTQNPGY